MKKLAAGFLAALMSLMSTVLAVPLNQYPFEEVPYVVVGSGAAASDVVGAVDLAIRFAELQITRERIPGIAPTIEIDGEWLEGDIRGSAPTTTIEYPVYSKLYKAIVTDTAGVDHNVWEEITAGIATYVVEDAEVLADIDQYAVKYKITYYPAMDVGEMIKILGKDYEIIEIPTATELKLGETEVATKLGIGDTAELGGYVAKVIMATDKPSVIVEIIKDEVVLNSTELDEAGERLIADEGKFMVELIKVFVGYIDPALTQKAVMADLKLIWVNTIVTEGEDSPWDANYIVETVTATAGTDFESLVLANKLYTHAEPDPAVPEQVAYLKVGEKFAGPAGYFEVIYVGPTKEAVETIEAGLEFKLTFLDANEIETTVPMDKLKSLPVNTSGTKDEVFYIGVDGFPIKVTVLNLTTPDNYIKDVKVEYAGWAAKVRCPAAGGDPEWYEGTYKLARGVELSASCDAAVDSLGIASAALLTTKFGANLTFANNITTITQGDGTTIELNATATVYYEVVFEDTLTEENKAGLTNYGSKITTGAEMESVVIEYPEAKITVRSVLGEYKEIPVDAYREVIQPIRTPLAKLDTEIVDPTTLDRNIILVGGSCANALVQRLVDEGYLAEEYGCPGGVPGAAWVEGKGFIIAIEDAFGSGQIAVVVAGTTRVETRLATTVLQRYEEYLTPLAENVTMVEVTEVAGLPYVAPPA